MVSAERTVRRAAAAAVDPSHRSNSFDTLRLIGALLVLAGHSFHLLAIPAPRLVGIPIHSLGLDIFFAISGFLVTRSYLRDGRLVPYMAKRSLRIFPGLIASLLVLALVVGPFVTTLPASAYFRDRHVFQFVVQNAALYYDDWLPGWYEFPPFNGGANGSLWTLPIEFGLYLFVPLACLLLPARRHAAASLVLLLSLAVMWFSACSGTPLNTRIYHVSLDGALEVVPFFLAGCGLAFGDTADLLRHRRLLLCASVLIAVASPFFAGGWSHVLSLLPLTLLTILIGQSRWLAFGWLERLGDLSYGIYLSAWPIQSIVIANLAGTLDVWSISALTALVAGAYAFFSWRLVEKPALALKEQMPARSSPDWLHRRRRTI